MRIQNGKLFFEGNPFSIREFQRVLTILPPFVVFPQLNATLWSLAYYQDPTPSAVMAVISSFLLTEKSISVTYGVDVRTGLNSRLCFASHDKSSAANSHSIECVTFMLSLSAHMPISITSLFFKIRSLIIVSCSEKKLSLVQTAR